MMMNVFRQFFCWWPQSSDRLWASSSSSEDGFPIHGSIRRGTYTRKGKSTEGVTDAENSLSHQRSCFYTNPQLNFSVDGEALQASIRNGPDHLAPCVSQTPAWHSLQRRTLVALTWPVQLLAPRGAQDDFSEVLSSDWLRLCLWIVRPQKAELIFREEFQAKKINSVLYIVHRLFKELLLK